MVEREHSKKASPVKGRILVMEEDSALRTLIRKMLTNHGYEVSSAKDGIEAIGLYQIAQASGHSFDAVILDFTVHFGMGGVETIQKLIEIDPDVKGIVSSGHSFNDVIVNCCKYGFCGAITKPFTMHELMTTVNEAIENK